MIFIISDQDHKATCMLSYLLQDLSSDCEFEVTPNSNPFLAKFLLKSAIT